MYFHNYLPIKVYRFSNSETNCLLSHINAIYIPSPSNNNRKTETSFSPFLSIYYYYGYFAHKSPKLSNLGNKKSNSEPVVFQRRKCEQKVT